MIKSFTGPACILFKSIFSCTVFWEEYHTLHLLQEKENWTWVLVHLLSASCSWAVEFWGIWLSHLRLVGKVPTTRGLWRRKEMKFADVICGWKVLSPYHIPVFISTINCNRWPWIQAWLCSVFSSGGEQREMDTTSQCLLKKTFPSIGKDANKQWLWPSWKCDAFLFWRTGNNTTAYSALNHTRVYVWRGLRGPRATPYLTCLISTRNFWCCHWRMKKWRYKWKSTGLTISSRMSWSDFKTSADTHGATSRIWVNSAKRCSNSWNFEVYFRLFSMNVAMS